MSTESASVLSVGEGLYQPQVDAALSAGVSRPIDELAVLGDSRTQRSASVVAFGGALRAARRSKGWSLQRVAELVGVHLSTLSRIECGRIAPNVGVRDKVLSLFQGDADLLRELGHLMPSERLPGIESYLMLKYDVAPADADRIGRLVTALVDRHRATPD